MAIYVHNIHQETSMQDMMCYLIKEGYKRMSWVEITIWYKNGTHKIKEVQVK